MRRFVYIPLFPAVAAALLGVGVPFSLALGQVPVAATQSAAEVAAAEAASLRKDRAAWEAQLKEMPAARVGRLRDVVNFSIENDDIVVRTSVAPTDGAAVVLDGKPTLIRVSAQQGDAPAPAPDPAQLPGQLENAAYQPLSFTLIQHAYPPAGGLAITQVNVIAPRVQLSKSAQGSGEFRNVDFIQSDEFLENGEGRVRLYIQEHRDDEPIVDLKLSAVSVAELRRKYPAETMRYLEPIFREFGQSGVLFQVSAPAAWQVLGGTYTPPAGVVTQVDAVLAKLDADDFRQREAAAKELETLGQPAALVLMTRDRTTLSEEQQVRVETFLAPYKPLSDDEATRLRGDTEFLLAALSSQDAELAGRALERLKEVVKQPIAFDLQATGDARAEAIASLRAQLLPATTQPATAQPPTAPSTPRPATNAAPLEPFDIE